MPPPVRFFGINPQRFSRGHLQDVLLKTFSRMLFHSHLPISAVTINKKPAIPIIHLVRPWVQGRRTKSPTPAAILIAPSFLPTFLSKIISSLSLPPPVPADRPDQFFKELRPPRLFCSGPIYVRGSTKENRKPYFSLYDPAIG
jgi:hypothetical protein